MEIYNISFDGYSPESKLKGEQVEMRINDMDFWESEKTGLQMTIFPHYAAILEWRGTGKFKATLTHASQSKNLYLLTKPQKAINCEIFPDENKLFEDLEDLEGYIVGLDISYVEFKTRR